ncbi:TPA: fumarate hydratase C-terminal domain-containing protein [Pseudomonas putida]|nr:fumarate hydratase C-terminal domain-containing protein [Pseudomonas putida]
MSTPKIIRSALFVPGSRPERFAKALASKADVVIVDFEDAVEENLKEQAHANLSEFLIQTHAASLPICIIPNCAATRHVHFTLDGSGPANLVPPDVDTYPSVAWEAGKSVRRVNLDTVTQDDVRAWEPGETLLLSGKLLTGRDAAHKRMVEMMDRGEPLPVDLKGRFIYYVGPVDPVRDEVVGPAGPTTSTRMDKFTPRLLAETGLLGMIGKSERGPVAIEAIKAHEAVYLMAVGGAAYLVSQAITKSRVIAFEDLGMEAIYEFELKDMPTTVAVDALGESVHETGPQQWAPISAVVWAGNKAE